MNRILKFRVWNNKLNKFIYRLSIGEINASENNGKHGVTFSEICDDENSLNAKDCVTQQFTGLQDKNGEDIYEGDIVKTLPDYISILFSNAGEYSAGEVRWWNEGFALCQKNIGATRISEYSHCECCPSGLEIIGNIFENPELCEK